MGGAGATGIGFVTGDVPGLTLLAPELSGPRESFSGMALNGAPEAACSSDLAAAGAPAGAGAAGAFATVTTTTALVLPMAWAGRGRFWLIAFREVELSFEVVHGRAWGLKTIKAK